MKLINVPKKNERTNVVVNFLEERFVVKPGFKKKI